MKPPPAAAGRPTAAAIIRSLLLTALLLYLFLVGVGCLSSGIKALGSGVMNTYMSTDMNPLLGLLVGILATTLVQSSSVTTSLIVGLVATGEVQVSTAVPMIMGANIGTTVTNTIAAMAQSAASPAFRRAFAAATCHDFFNFLAVTCLLPFELITRAVFGKGFLESTSFFIAELTMGTTGAKYKSPLKASLKWGVQQFSDAIAWLGLDGRALAIALAVVGLIVIFFSLTMIVKTMKTLVLARMERYINRFLGSGGAVAMLVGVVLTVMVQSSSITTSVLVPLAGAGVVTLRQIFPITLGANIGTTITALLASLAATGEASLAARQIALVHLLFNLSGILIWYVPPFMRGVPLRAAEWLAAVATRSKKVAIGYVLAVFYAVPAAIFFLSRAISGG